MARRLFIAAGGGGDPIAAAMVARTIAPESPPPWIATYSWDRLSLDPLPGPRDPSDFTGLEAVGRWNYRVPESAKVRPPGASALPRLASELEADLLLLDPRGGAEGLCRQISELAGLCDAEQVFIVDVGGDILACGDEPTLRSPLADSLVLAAVGACGRDFDVFVAGPGLDGELTADDVLGRCRSLATRPAPHRFDAGLVEGHGDVFRWHPSEASGLFWAAAMGLRGVVEARDAKVPLHVTDDSAVAWQLSGPSVLAGNRIARALSGTTSLREAECRLAALGAPSELDYERRKSAEHQRWARPGPDETSYELIERVRRIESAARNRGADYITLRGLAEDLGLSLSDLHALRDTLPSLSDAPSLPCWPVR